MSVQAISPQVQTSQIAKKPKRYPWHAIASFALPGAGQFIKGDKEKGKRDLGISIGLVATSLLTAFAMGINKHKKFKTAKNIEEQAKIAFSQDYSSTEMALFAFYGIGSFVNKIHSAYDAYKAEPVKESEKT